MSVQSSKSTYKSTQATRSIESTLDRIRRPFQPLFDPTNLLADEIESSKRKIWECIGPIERERYLEQQKIVKTSKTRPPVVAGNEENVQHHHTNNGKKGSNDSAPINGMSKVLHVTKSPFKGNAAMNSNNSRSPTKAKKTGMPKRADVEFKVNAMKVVELKRELKKHGCETSGLKKDLRARLLRVMISQLEQFEEEEKLQQHKNIVAVPVQPPPSQPIANVARPSNELADTNAPTTITTADQGNLDAQSQQSEKSEYPTSSFDAPIKQPEDVLNVPESSPVVEENFQMDEQARASISSMEVEHHTSGAETCAQTNKVVSDTTTSPSSDRKESVSRPMSLSSTTDHCQKNVNDELKETASKVNESDVSTEHQQTSTPSSPQAFITKTDIEAGIGTNGYPSTTSWLPKTKPVPKDDSMAVDNMVRKESLDVESDISAPASEVSESTKSSGKSVKDMVSKFSTFSTMSASSSTSGSALSKGLQAKRDARLARNAEIREKSKPVKTTKVALISKDYTSTLSSLTSTAVSGISKKQTLAAQMREKAAANALKNGSTKFAMSSSTSTVVKPTSLSATTTVSKPVFGSAQHTTSTQSPTGLQQDSLSFSKMKTPQFASLAKPRIMSPMDTYEISDREDSETDDSDSEAEGDSKPKKRIPVWAHRSNLLKALEEQYNGRGQNGERIDPDDIFPEVQSCNLEAIFGDKKSKYRTRNSSGNWMNDRVTAAEKLIYKRDMGFQTKNVKETEV